MNRQYLYYINTFTHVLFSCPPGRVVCGTTLVCAMMQGVGCLTGTTI